MCLWKYSSLSLDHTASLLLWFSLLPHPSVLQRCWAPLSMQLYCRGLRSWRSVSREETAATPCRGSWKSWRRSEHSARAQILFLTHHGSLQFQWFLQLSDSFCDGMSGTQTAQEGHSKISILAWFSCSFSLLLCVWDHCPVGTPNWAQEPIFCWWF